MFIKIIYLVLASLSFLGPQVMAMNHCKILSDWVAIKNTIANEHSTLLSVRNILYLKEKEIRTNSSMQVFNQYLKGSIDFDDFNECLRTIDDHGDFLNSLYSVFWNETFRILRTNIANSQKNVSCSITCRFLKLFDDKYKKSGAPFFKLSNKEFNKNKSSELESSSNNPNSYKAGFHSGVKSIFADFQRIKNSEWLIVFIHEIIHSLDQELENSLAVYNNKDTLQQLIKLSQTTNNPNELNPEDLKLLDVWLRAGLSVGLWAEYRAWSATIAIYKQGLLDGLWGESELVNSILIQNTDLQEIEIFLYGYLDSLSLDPTENIFKWPLISSELKNIRNSYIKTKKTPQLGILKLAP